MKVVIDTNVYIIAALDLAKGIDSAEVKVVKNAGKKFRVVISKEIMEQIMRVARRVGDKDLGSRIINALWIETSPVFVQTYKELIEVCKDKVPGKDAAIFAAALVSNADYLISEDENFLRMAERAHKNLRCLKPAEFIEKMNL